MRLPKHAVGFWHARSEPFPEINVDTLARAVRDSAIPSGVWIGHVDRAEYPRSFHAMRLRSRIGNRTDQYDLLCAQHLPWVAFCHVTPDYMGFEVNTVFREPPPWASLLAELDYRVLSHAELQTPSAEIDTSELTPAARGEVKYWRPNCLAEFLFNWWD
ncbi:hypothetical protein [Glycomyces sp. NRRL B-16210]|uniref:hypothetical protein n=1 Tax=Glycomyces sp. NRRL B-16210 TaxID=1463821 RepID=UPI0004C117E8|nr:hypothetical protein [Glycomyces sp. NRRL B-16210]